MPNFSGFDDFAQHYAQTTSQYTYGAAFAAEIESSQLSIHDEPTQADMPDPKPPAIASRNWWATCSI
jgi:hypothetical protein